MARIQGRRVRQALAALTRRHRQKQGAGVAACLWLRKLCNTGIANGARRPTAANRALPRKGWPRPCKQCAEHGLNILGASAPHACTLMIETPPPTIDPVAAARWARNAPAQSPWLHEEVARRMQDRLQWIKLQPAHWAHWAPVRGGLEGHALVARHYPAAQAWVMEPEAHLQQRSCQALHLPWWRAERWRRVAPRFDAPADAQVQMLWANMALHMTATPQALLAQWHRVLAVDGFLMFSALGPDTLHELRGVYAALGWPPPGHAFTDMHDWGDMLVGAGFAEPVMDMERVVLTWETPARLLQELRELGVNLHPQRYAGLRTPRWKARLEAALVDHLTSEAHGGRLALTFEIVYGHGLKPLPRLALRAQSAVSLEDMRAMLHGGARPREAGR